MAVLFLLVAGASALIAPSSVSRRQLRAGATELHATKNSAFVFVKPHAVTAPTIDLVRSTLEKAGVSILREGDISSAAIDEKKLVDQHYYAIASKATITPPAELNVPADKFRETFGEEWVDVLAQGRAKTAIDAGVALGLDGNALEKVWGEAKGLGNIVKLGGGFYCGRIGEGPDSIYTFNAFYMSMRDRFTAPGGSIHYYVVEWDADALAWSEFRGTLLGPTDPAAAPAASIRGQIFSNWEQLGLKGEPNTGDNGVHASASPLEGLAERLNWLESDLAADSFGAALLTAGVTRETIAAWSVDPQVGVPEGGKRSLFDFVEDTDVEECLKRLLSVSA